MAGPDFLRKLQLEAYTDDAISRRSARRAHRQGQIYAKIQDAIAETQGDFNSRYADLWTLNQEESGLRKIEGHPGRCASMYVSECLGEYDIRGTVRTRYAGMERTAGKGGHGITDGTITIEADIQPIKGMKQTIEVPVYVKNGYMIQPGVFLNQGVPTILAQSSLDDLVECGTFTEVETDRRNMFSPPRTAASMGSSSIPKSPQTQREVEQAKKDWESRQEGKSPGMQPKRPRRAPEQTFDFDDGGSNGHEPAHVAADGDHDMDWGDEFVEESHSDSDDPEGTWSDVHTKEWGPEGEVENTWTSDNAEGWGESSLEDMASAFMHEHPGFSWAEDQMPMVYTFAEENGVEIPDFIDALNDLEYGHDSVVDHGGDGGSDQRSSDHETLGHEPDLGHDQDYTGVEQAHPLRAEAGQMYRLASAIKVPSTGAILNQGSRVFVVRPLDDGMIHVKHASGIEVVVEAESLS